MKYLKIILIWLTLSMILGVVVKYANDNIPEKVIYIIFIFTGLVIGTTQSVLRYFGEKSEKKILSEAMKMYNGKINFNGEPEIYINGKRIILDYELEQAASRATEYIIAYIDLTDFNKSQIKKCEKDFEILKKNNKNFAVIYTAWGYKGEQFKERLEKKIQQIDECMII